MWMPRGRRAHGRGQTRAAGTKRTSRDMHAVRSRLRAMPKRNRPSLRRLPGWQGKQQMPVVWPAMRVYLRHAARERWPSVPATPWRWLPEQLDKRKQHLQRIMQWAMRRPACATSSCQRLRKGAINQHHRTLAGDDRPAPFCRHGAQSDRGHGRVRVRADTKIRFRHAELL